MAKPTEDELDKLEHAMSSFVRILRKPGYWAEVSKRAGVSIDRPAAAILQILSHQHCQFQTLVNRLGVEAPSVSRKVHELENHGMIVRQPTSDRRVHELHLSSVGRQIAKKVCTAKREVLVECLTQWSPEERQHLTASFEHLAQDMSARFDDKPSKRRS